ncbi:MAG TPA: hypothetical protein VM778_01485 [Gemmatimonadota bacterium]|nr:hypothetical protein [Gemmatimonadota bacterium]
MRGFGARMAGVVLGAAALAACASGGGAVGMVALDQPEAVSGDDTAIAWPFVVTHGGQRETFADFHLRIESGATLLGVRPDAENPDPGARFKWSGSVVSPSEGYWIGSPLTPGGEVRLWLLVRPTPGAEPRLRVVHWPTDGRDEPVGPETCEVWSWSRDRATAHQEPC